MTERAVKIVLEIPEDKMFKVEKLPDFKFSRPKGSFAKVKCSKCGEYAFERYVRTVEGKPICIPCSGFTESRLDALKGMQ